MCLIHLLLINRIHILEKSLAFRNLKWRIHAHARVLLYATDLQNNEAGNDVKDLTGSPCVSSI